MKLIKLQRDKVTIKVNPDNINYMDSNGQGTNLYFVNEVIGVKETMDEIESLIQKADNL